MNISDNDLNSFEPFTVTYASNEYNLRGYLLLPDGPGPFPAIIFQHGSSGLLPSNKPGIEALQQLVQSPASGAMKEYESQPFPPLSIVLAPPKVFRGKTLGYAVFVALRRGYNNNPGPYWLSLVTASWGSPEMDMQLIQALHGERDDVIAALDWLRSQVQIDPERIAIVGHSFGGAVTILAAEHTQHFQAGISFAGPSQTWPDAPTLQKSMLTAIQRTTMPFFLIQAQNDHSLMPTYTLGTELARLNKPHETRIYPPLGTTPMEGHGIFGRGVEWWYADVKRFLARYL